MNLEEATIKAMESKLIEEANNFFYNQDAGEDSEVYQLKNYGFGHNDTCAFGTPDNVSIHIDELIAEDEDQDESCEEIRKAIDLACKKAKYILFTTDNGYYNYIYEIDENGNEIKLLIQWA